MDLITAIIVVSILVWAPVLLLQISRNGFLVLLVWLFIAPIVTNILQGERNPFFKTPSSQSVQKIATTERERAGSGYKTGGTNIKVQELLEPTRNLVVVFFLIFVINAVIQRKGWLRLDKTELWMSIFAIILLANVCLQSNRLLFGLRTAGDAFIVPFLAYFIARRLVSSEERYLQLTTVLAYFAAYVVILCFIERILAPRLIYRVTGPFSHPSNLNIVMGPLFFVMLLAERNNLTPLVQKGLMFSIASVVVLTLTRGNWVGFLAGVTIAVFLGLRLVRKLRKVELLGFGIVAASLVMISLPSVVPTEVLEERLGAVSTINWRLIRWQITIQEALERPFFGLGFNNLRDVLGGRGLNFAAAHNAFLSMFAELGIIGLSAYLLIVKSIFHLGWKLYRNGEKLQDRWRGVAVIGALVTYQIPGFFNNEFYSSELGAFYLFVFLGAVAGLYRRSLIPHRRIMVSGEVAGMLEKPQFSVT